MPVRDQQRPAPGCNEISATRNYRVNVESCLDLFPPFRLGDAGVGTDFSFRTSGLLGVGSLSA